MSARFVGEGDMTQRPDLKQIWGQFVYGLTHPSDPSPPEQAPPARGDGSSASHGGSTSDPGSPPSDSGAASSTAAHHAFGGADAQFANPYADEPAAGVENPYADESPHAFHNPYADPPPDPVEEAARRRRNIGRILQFFGSAMVALAVLGSAVLIWNVVEGTADRILASVGDLIRRFVVGGVVLYVGRRLAQGKPILPNRRVPGPGAEASGPSDPSGATPPAAQ